MSEQPNPGPLHKLSSTRLHVPMDYFPYPNFIDGTASSSSSSQSVTIRSSKEKKIKASKKGKATVKLSTDPQSVAARERRHRISDRFKILQSMVPGGTKMDTVSMLDEAIHYVKFLKTQIRLHQAMINNYSSVFVPGHFPVQGNEYPSLNPGLNLPAAAMQPPQLLPLPDSCFQDHQQQQNMTWDVFMKHH